MDPDGSLILMAGTASVRQPPPVSWQVLPSGGRRAVMARFVQLGASRYTLTAKVTAPARPKGKSAISPVNDPHLDTQELPVRSAAGQPIRITGRSFSINPV